MNLEISIDIQFEIKVKKKKIVNCFKISSRF